MIRNRKTHRILSSYKHPRGYRCVSLSIGDGNKHTSVPLGKLILFTFGHSDNIDGKVVFYKDGDKNNCNITNLDWRKRNELNLNNDGDKIPTVLKNKYVSEEWKFNSRTSAAKFLGITKSHLSSLVNTNRLFDNTYKVESPVD